MGIFRIKEKQKEQRVSSKQLSELAGISEATISSIINGNSSPRTSVLLDIAQALKVDVRDLFNPTKERSENEIINNIIRDLELLKEKQ